MKLEVKWEKAAFLKERFRSEVKSAFLREKDFEVKVSEVGSSQTSFLRGGGGLLIPHKLQNTRPKRLKFSLAPFLRSSFDEF